MKKRILFAAFAACLLAGCDNDDLEKRVDSLENRLEIVEKTLTEINSGISSLQTIVKLYRTESRFRMWKKPLRATSLLLATGQPLL